MTPIFVQMMILQGEIKVEFMRLGIDTGKADDLASEAIHRFLTSDLVKDEAKQLYQEHLNKTESRD